MVAESKQQQRNRPVAARSGRQSVDPIDAALEAAFPAFPDEVAAEQRGHRVAASASAGLSGIYPGAADALQAIYSAATGRPASAVYGSAGAQAPEAFPGSGDIPLATASGMDPKLLERAPWQARWAIANAPTMAEASSLLNESSGMAAAFPASTSWPPTGLDPDATSYFREFSQYLSGFKPNTGRCSDEPERYCGGRRRRRRHCRCCRAWSSR